MQTIRFGIIGGGLMGREFASAVARWCHLLDFPARPVLVAVASRTEKSCAWFRENIPGVEFTTTDYRELLRRPGIEAIYCAVPHNLHHEIYSAVIRAGKHLLGEKPFGMDAAENRAILKVLEENPRVIARCVSQFPFYPGAWRICRDAEQGRFGRILEVEAGFLHSSDLDPDKPINWKRIVSLNGEYGCMGDLGMHVLHVPLRVGWSPSTVYALLDNVRPRRKNERGEWVACDTWDNATLLCRVENKTGGFPMTLKFQRIAPGELNTWYLKVRGDEYSASFSLKRPRTLDFLEYQSGGPQNWCSADLGYEPVYPAVTGRIFEFGFPDAFQQMLAAFVDRLARGKEGQIPFECATPEETSRHHDILSAALDSHRERKASVLD